MLVASVLPDLLTLLLLLLLALRLPLDRLLRRDERVDASRLSSADEGRVDAPPDLVDLLLRLCSLLDEACACVALETAAAADMLKRERWK